MRGTSTLPIIVTLLLIMCGGSAAEETKPKVAPNKDQAMPLRRLAKQLSDRGPIVDPTRDVSTAAALKTPLPARKRPVPFAAINLPDPFERRQTVKLPTTPAEDPTPVTRFLRAPKR